MAEELNKPTEATAPRVTTPVPDGPAVAVPVPRISAPIPDGPPVQVPDEAQSAPTAPAPSIAVPVPEEAQSAPPLVAAADGSPQTAQDVLVAEPPPKESERKNPDAILEHIDVATRDEMVEMGFGVIPSEKALYHSGGHSQDQALNWLEEHQDDEDLDVPLPADFCFRPKLTSEEAAAKALELQRQARERRAEIEKAQERQREKQRIESQKKMSDASRLLEEQSRARQSEEMKREKTMHDLEAQRLKDVLRREHHERFGPDVPFPDDIKHSTDTSNVKTKKEKEQVIFWINELSKKYKAQDPAALKRCFATLTAYITNAKDHPNEPKYHKIMKGNKAFSERVAPYSGAVELLDVVGFKDTGDQLEIIGAIDGFTMAQALKFIEVLMRQL